MKKTLCPDIAATDMKISLVSTEIGMPGIEFPRDKVKLDITIKNVGTAKAPSNFAIFLYKNDERIATLPTGTTDPGGGTWLFGYYDGFPHDVRTSYKVVAAPAFGECRTDNNEMVVIVDEYQLHPDATAGLDLSVTQLTVEDGFYIFFGDIVGAAIVHVTVRNNSPREAFPHEWKWSWTVDGVTRECSVSDGGFHPYPSTSFGFKPWESKRIDFSFSGMNHSDFANCRQGMVVQYRVKVNFNCERFGNEREYAHNETPYQTLVTFKCRDR